MSRCQWFVKTCPKLALAAILCLATGTVRNGWGQTPPAPPAGQATPPAASTVGPDDVVLTIGDRNITKAEFEETARALPPQFSGAMGQLGMRGFADQYGNLLSLAMEGEKRNLHEQDSFQKMMEFQRLMLLGQVTLNALASSTTVVPPQEVKAYYEANPADFQEAKLRGIYVPFDGSQGAAAPEAQEGEEKKGLTEAEALAKANALRDRIRAGEDMAEMAAKESEHPTASKNGEFGYVRRNQFAPEIDRVIFSLELNQVSEPVKDRFGFFLLQVEEKRPQPLEQATPIIENNLRQQKLGGILGKLKQDYPVTLNPNYFPPAAQPMTMPPGMPAPPRQQ